MSKSLKKALDSARANLNTINQQHKTASEKKDIIFARGFDLNNRLNSAAEQLETAKMQNLRGVIDDAQLESVRSQYQAVRMEKVRQSEDEEAATRAVNLSVEHGNATAELGIARAAYFEEISENIKHPLRGDNKLRKQLLSLDAANSCIHGCLPSEPGAFDRRTWMEMLMDIFPIPTNEEERLAYADFMRAYDSSDK